MRRFQKGPPPPVLAGLKREAKARRDREQAEGAVPGEKTDWDYVRGAEKAELRTAAVAEQQGLCAYCMRRITSDETTKMEHWRPRSDPATDHFLWADLLAVCPGGAGSMNDDDRSCDERRGDRPLALHPARAVSCLSSSGTPAPSR